MNKINKTMKYLTYLNKQKEDQTLTRLTFKCKITKFMLVISPKHTVIDLSNVCSNQAPLKYSGEESKNYL